MTSFQVNRVIFLLVVYFMFVINRHYGNFVLDIVKENFNVDADLRITIKYFT